MSWAGRAGSRRLAGVEHHAICRTAAPGDRRLHLRVTRLRYFARQGLVPLADTVEGTQSSREFVEQYAAKGNCRIGTDDAIAHIEFAAPVGLNVTARPRLAPPPATFHSYELFARAVIPYFKGSTRGAGRRTIGEASATTRAGEASSKPSPSTSPSKWEAGSHAGAVFPTTTCPCIGRQSR